MPKRRISSARRRPSRSALKSTEENLQYMGISLSGGKADKSCVAVLDYYPAHKKIFLTKVIEKIKSEEFISADLKIHEIVTQYSKNILLIGIDAPLNLPKCVTCKLECPGYENCEEEEIEWLRAFYLKINKTKKPKKMFTPYTQRVLDAYLMHALEEKFEVHHALGANLAPLTTRAMFISRRLKHQFIEVSPRLSVYRIGKELKLARNQIKFHKNSIGGSDIRRAFLHALTEKKGLFIYEQDLKSLVENSHAFEAFICAYSAFLHNIGLTEAKPDFLPEKEPWVALPKA